MPIDEIQDRWHRHVEQQVAERASLDPDDVTLQYDIQQHWNEQYAILSSWYHDQTLEATPPNITWQCPYCDSSFAHRSLMRRHITKNHQAEEPKYVYLAPRDAMQGLPQCRHCLQKLHSRNNLKLHIERKWCTAFDPHAEVQESLCQQPWIQASLQERDWSTLLRDEDLCQQLVNHCGLCQHWSAQTNSLAAHLKKAHQSEYQASLVLRPEIAALTRIENKQCSACQIAVNQQHTCPVVMQIAIMQSWHETRSMTKTETASPPTSGQKRKSPFDGAYHDHDLVEAPIFEAARDCFEGKNVCSHCMQNFSDHTGLRRHIDLHRCPRFQEKKEPSPMILGYNREVLNLMNSPYPDLWFEDQTMIQKLKTECAICGRKFDTQKSLMKHLEGEHKVEHDAAMPYAKHLQDHFQTLGQACLCGLWRCKDLVHKCNVGTQLGILRKRARQIMPMPTQGMIPPLLDLWLREGQIGKVLDHPEYSDFFQNYCGTCLIRVSDAADLWEHLEVTHESMMSVGIQELEQMTRERDYCCPACESVTAQVRSQAPKCPFLLNCLILQRVRNGFRHHESHRDGHSSRTTGSVRPPDRTSSLTPQHAPQFSNQWATTGQTAETRPTTLGGRNPRFAEPLASTWGNYYSDTKIHSTRYAKTAHGCAF